MAYKTPNLTTTGMRNADGEGIGRGGRGVVRMINSHNNY